jgi:hypothetical protein
VTDGQLHNLLPYDWTWPRRWAAPGLLLAVAVVADVRFLRKRAAPSMKKIECFLILAMTVMALLAVAPSGARNTGNTYCSNCSGAQTTGTDK